MPTKRSTLLRSRARARAGIAGGLRPARAWPTAARATSPRPTSPPRRPRSRAATSRPRAQLAARAKTAFPGRLARLGQGRRHRELQAAEPTCAMIDHPKRTTTDETLSPAAGRRTGSCWPPPCRPSAARAQAVLARRSAARSRRSSANTCSSNPEVLQEVIAELEKRQAAAEAEKHQDGGQGERRGDLQFAAPGRARQSAGRRHVGRVLRLQLRLLQARAGRHDRADEGRSEAEGRAQGIPGARRRLGRGGAGRGRGAHAGQDRRRSISIPPEAARQPRPDRQGARARGRQGDRPRRRAGREGHGRRRGAS